LEQIMTDPIAEAAANLSDAEAAAELAAQQNNVAIDPQTASIPAPGVLSTILQGGTNIDPQEAGTAAAGESPQSSPASTTSTTLVPSSAELPNADAGTSPAGAATPASTGNVLVNAAPAVDAPVIDAPAAEPVAEVAELPRESHLMLLEAKFANALAKLRNAERVSVDELEAIYVHIKAVI
jgi:hypothetical protein